MNQERSLIISMLLALLLLTSPLEAAKKPRRCSSDFGALVDSTLPNVPKWNSIERVGEHFLIKGERLKESLSLSSAIARNPKYFKKFEIEFRDDGTLVLPTTKRLRTLVDQMRKAADPSAPSVNFFPSLEGDVDSTFEYLANISNRRRPFFPISLQGASSETDSLFLHDWTAHWLGMATMPDSLVREIRGTSALFRAIRSNPALMRNRRFMRNLKQYWASRIVDEIDLGTGLIATGLKTGETSPLRNGVNNLRAAGISQVTKQYLDGDDSLREVLRVLSPDEKLELDRLIRKFQDPKYNAASADADQDVQQILKVFNSP